MASNFKLGTLARNAACDGLVDYIDTGTGAGRIEIRTGSPPTNVGDASTGTLLGTLTFSATAFGSASSGTATANTITADSDNNATGVAGYFRIYTATAGEDEASCQGTCGESADTPDLVFNEKTIIQHGTCSCSSFTITVPIT